MNVGSWVSQPKNAITKNTVPTRPTQYDRIVNSDKSNRGAGWVVVRTTKMTTRATPTANDPKVPTLNRPKSRA